MHIRAQDKINEIRLAIMTLFACDSTPRTVDSLAEILDTPREWTYDALKQLWNVGAVRRDYIGSDGKGNRIDANVYYPTKR